ncbi:MAG: DUF4202 domain-containing protein [Hyphomicrobiales bacterium]|nr:MAG: DUF4202 domain-containing protein [Hyphomicrobiales bacterium]
MSNFEAVIKAIDEANAESPRKITVDGREQSYENVYSERMSAVLARLYPDASELLKIAARAQHIRRWDIPRSDFPTGPKGYNRWRKTCREHHAELMRDIMSANGYTEADIEAVGTYLKKEKLKKNDESQALENVVDVVFLEYYWDEFVEKFPQYDDDKLIDIVGKTLLKMSSHGHQAALALDLPADTLKIVGAALERQKDKLAALAAAEQNR